MNNINNNPLLKGIKENKNQETSVLRVNNNPLLKNVKNSINNDTKNVKNTSVLNTKVNAPKKIMNLATSKKQDGKWYNEFFKSSDSFKDGYDAGDVTKTALSSIGDWGLNVVEGFAQVPEQIGTLIAGAESQVADWLGFDEHADNVRKRIANNGGALISTLAQRGQDSLDKNSVLDSTSDNVASGVGQVLSYLAGSKVPVIGSTVSVGGKLNVPMTAVLSGAGSGLTEAYQKENIKDWQAWAKASGSGAIEGIVEGLFGTLGIGGSSLDDAITKSVSNHMKSGLTKALAQTSIKAVGEGVEEQISYISNFFLNKGIDIMSEVTGDTKVKFSEDWNSDEFWENFFVSGLSAMITQGGGTALNITRTQNQAIKDAEKQLNRSLTTEEKNNLKKHISLLAMQSAENDITIEDQKIVNNVVDNKVNELKKSGKNLTNSELIELRNQTVNELKSKNIVGNTNVNNNSIQETSPIYGTQKQENPLKTIFEEKTKQVKTEISPVYTQNKSFVTTSNTLNALDSTSKTNSDTAPINNIIPQNQNFENTNPLLTTFKDKIRLKTQSEIEYNKSAKRYGIDTNNETVKSIFRVANERGIEVKYDAKAFSSTKQNAYWNDKKDSNREIVINPNADTNKALQSIIIHEILHDMEGTKEYNRLAKIVLEYAKEQGGYETALEDIKNIYSKFYDSNSKDFMKKIRHEMVADILGEKFGNQEFLNTLVKKDRTVMQKIHDFIIDLLNKLNSLTGYKYTKVYWQDVESKLRNAFNQEFVSENSKKYHVSKNLNDDIDKVLSNKYTLSNDVKLRDYTPEILVKSGIKDFPMLINQNHLKENILSITKAKKLGIYNKDANYHNLGKTLFMNAIDSLDDPLAIIKSISKSSKKNTYIIITDIQDKKGNQIIVPIYLQTKGNYNNIEIDTNKIKSIYGKTNVKDFVDRTIKENVNNVIYLTNDKNKRQLITTTGLQLSNNSNTVTTNTISQNTHKVNNLHNSKMSVSGNIINNKENGFYSQLERTITNKMQNSATADSVLNLIKNNGVKQDELNWTGIEEYLQDKGNEKVTKQEVLDYIKANQLEIITGKYGDYQEAWDIPQYKTYSTNFGGGENYREVLYTISDKATDDRKIDNYYSPHWGEGNVLAHTRLQDYKDVEGNKVLFIEEIQSDMHQQGRRTGYITAEDRKLRSKLKLERDILNDESTTLKEQLKKIAEPIVTKWKNYHREQIKKAGDKSEAIWRKYGYNDKARNELDRYFYIAEYNSMGEEEYKELGKNAIYVSYEDIQEYIKANLDENVARENFLKTYEVSTELKGNKEYETIKNKLDENENKILSIEEELHKFNSGTIDSRFPFKKNWHEFVLRKVINEAVQKGYDKVAWTTGKQQSDRYNLAEYVDKIQYHAYLNPNNESQKLYNINAIKDESSVISRGGINESDLKELLGKDIATKIINSDNYDGTIEGENLSVGGEGMKGFYDKIIPEYLSKYLKKWNSKIENVYIGKDLRNTSEYKKGGIEALKNIVNNSNTNIHIQQGFTITPEMKKSVQETGQPIFSLVNNNSTWDSFLKEKFSNNGTKQTIKDVKLPTTKKIESNITKKLPLSEDSTKKYSVSDEEKFITLDDGNRYTLEEYKNVFGASEDSFNVIYNMQNKLPKTNLYQELKKKFAKEDYDNSIVEKAKVEVPANYQGRRTKTQWLSIAQKIGKNIEKEDIEKIAYHSWINERPNNKENLNRQGQKFVKFTLEEWLDNIQKGYEYRPIPNLPDIKTKSTKKSDKNQPKWIETSFSNEQIRKNINKSKFDDVTYIVQGNETTINRVNRKLEELSYEEAVREIDNAFNRHDNGKFAEIKGNNYTNFSLDECVMAQRLLQIAIDRQDIKTAESLISQIALAGTRAGQSIQALSLINRLSPEGQLLHLQRSTERLENQIKHKMKTKESEEKFTEETHKRAKEVTDKIQNKLIQYTEENSKHFSNLAKKLANKISDKVDIKEQMINNNLQDEIVKELYKLALESPIDIERRMKANNMTAIDKIKFALENKEVYGETWNQAKRILLKKYKHDAEIIIKLTNFFEKGIIPDYSMTTFKEAYEKTLNETGYKTKKAIIKTLTDEAKQKVEYINNLRPDQQKDIIKKVAQTIIDETGAKGNDANILAEQVVIEFFDSLKDNDIAELSKTVSKFKGIEITEEMKRKILSAKNIDKLNEIMDEVREEIAKQIPSTLSDKIRSWRYFSMLFNPQTHIRNIIGNMSMRIVANGKKVVARGIETVFDKEIEERTRTFEKASDEIKKFAKDDVNKMMDALTGENKLSMENKIMQKRKIFKNDKLDKLIKFNSELLEKEDAMALKTSYINNFAEYLTANKIRTNEDIKNNKELVEKGRIFATQEALKSTFRSNSNLANLLQQMENRLGISGQFLIGGLIPFKKTPINITKTALRYSPLGLIESITYESSRLKKGEITANEYIDKISSGLTGTGLAVLGMILFNAGVITAGSDGEKDEKYKQQLGWKPYAVRIGNTYYSLSWLSPTAIPIFIGAEITKNIQTDEELNVGAIAEGLGQALNPLMDMSMLQGINDALSSYNSNGLLGNIGNVAKTTAENYALQFIPTLSSKIASLTDNVVRTTTPSKNSEFKELESLGRRAMNKIPVLRNILEPKKDIWGEDVKNSENIVTRFIENFVLPTYGSKYTESEVDKAILQLYSKTGDDSIIPTVPNSYFTYDGNKYEMSAKEYTQYKETYGKNLNSKIKTIITSDAYKKLSNEQKVDIVSSVFKYASEEAKKEYLAGQDIEYSYSTTHMLYNLSEKFLDDNSTFKSLYYETKDTEALPIDTLNTFTYQNIKFKVTNEEKQSYAEDSYKVLSKIYNKLNNNSKFRKMSNESKIKILKEISSKYLSTLKKKYRLQVIKRAIKNKEYEIAK